MNVLEVKHSVQVCFSVHSLEKLVIKGLFPVNVGSQGLITNPFNLNYKPFYLWSLNFLQLTDSSDAMGLAEYTL